MQKTTVLIIVAIAATLVLIIAAIAAMLTARAESMQASNSIVLVRDGQPMATIMLAEKPTRSAQFATAELQYHVEKITGAVLPILTNAAGATGVCVFVGESDATRVMGLKNESFSNQEYLISFRKEGLVLMGRDKEDRGQLNYTKASTFPDGFDEQGTCYAVYDFLEKFCGVQWYLPTDLGLVYTPAKTLAVGGPDIRRQPFMRYRLVSSEMRIPADLCGDTVEGKKQPLLNRREAALWSRRNRMGGEPYRMNHSFYGYSDRFRKKNPKNPKVFEGEHPEWFAKGYEDEKSRHVQLCYTASGLVEQVVQDARDYFDGKPPPPGTRAKGDYFAVLPMDGSHYCKCPSCQKLLKEDAEQIRGRASDYVFSFVNKVAREVRKTHPDKYIATGAYSWYSDLPTVEKMEPNVSVSFSQCLRDVYWRELQENEARMLESWSSAAPDIRKFTWLYFCFPSYSARLKKYRCFPGFFATTLVRQMKEYHRYGIRGFFIEPSYLAYSQRSVLMDQLELYLMRKLADDPELDGLALMDEFFERYYGAAAKPMKKLYLAIERTYSDPANYPGKKGRQTAEIAWGWLGTRERMAEFGKLMAAAHAAARTDLEKQRVNLFDKGIWQYMVKGYKQYWPVYSGGTGTVVFGWIPP